MASFACPAVPDCAGVGDAEISILESAGAQYLQRASSLPLCMQPGSQGMKGAATPDVGLIAPAVAAMPRRTTRCIAMPRNALAIPFATLLQHTRDLVSTLEIPNGRDSSEVGEIRRSEHVH